MRNDNMVTIANSGNAINYPPNLSNLPANISQPRKVFVRTIPAQTVPPVGDAQGVGLLIKGED